MTVAVVLQDERLQMMPVPTPYAGYVEQPVRVSLMAPSRLATLFLPPLALAQYVTRTYLLYEVLMFLHRRWPREIRDNGMVSRQLGEVAISV